jgi:myo-inositol-1(or 4)-monophosphatase
MPEQRLNEYLEFAKETAYLAGNLTLNYFHAGTGVTFKKDDTPVTVADREAEELIRGRIKSRYPLHAIVGEEFGDSGSDEASLRWFIDPIDGTKSFMRGVPLYAVLIGLEIEGKIEVGVVYFPALNEILYASSGSGCFCNGKAVRVSKTTDFSRAVISFSDPKCFAEFGRKEAWERLKNACYYRAGLSDAYGHALVATGRMELMLDPIMSAWDCGPFPVILREAGGYFGDWAGNETIYANEALSTSDVLLQDVLRLIKG